MPFRIKKGKTTLLQRCTITFRSYTIDGTLIEQDKPRQYVFNLRRCRKKLKSIEDKTFNLNKRLKLVGNRKKSKLKNTI